MLSAFLASVILFDLRPTLNIGRNLDDLAADEIAMVLALVDQVKTNRHMPKSSDLLIQHDPAYPNVWTARVCEDTASPLRTAIADVVEQADGAEVGISCDAESGYFFEYTDSYSGIYRAGFRQDWYGSGNLYQLVALGPVSILIRTGVVTIN